MAKPKDAIPTTYQGVRMKSRFEANTAALLDEVGIVWRYEPMSFLLGKTHYQPDFYCADQSLWIECRGYDSPNGERQIELFSGMLSRGTAGVDCTIDTHPETSGRSNGYVVLRSDSQQIFAFLKDPMDVEADAAWCRKAGLALWWCPFCKRRSINWSGDWFSPCRVCNEFLPLRLWNLISNQGKVSIERRSLDAAESAALARCEELLALVDDGAPCKKQSDLADQVRRLAIILSIDPHPKPDHVEKYLGKLFARASREATKSKKRQPRRSRSQ